VIVVLDACVLYPPSLRDLLLSLAALDAFDVGWSDEILDEVTHNVLADHPDIDKARFVEHTIGAMRRAFPEVVVPAPELVETLDNDPKDRHVAATTLAADAQAIVTLNVADFESRVLRDVGVAILTPGALVGRVLDESQRSSLGRSVTWQTAGSTRRERRSRSPSCWRLTRRWPRRWPLYGSGSRIERTRTAVTQRGRWGGSRRRALAPSGEPRGIFAGSSEACFGGRSNAYSLTRVFVVVGTGVDPVTFRFSGGRSSD
jgi:predicted nucleic acid-binding protein